ncbi:hypothetical protein [Dickeya undicola]|uniref:hypothetical protein n=1 Tax=Dickeya undicola TaxID=1577887 RepID=UPI000A4E7960|nr:hypothetical protein [Dickeya undicola]
MSRRQDNLPPQQQLAGFSRFVTQRLIVCVAGWSGKVAVCLASGKGRYVAPLSPNTGQVLVTALDNHTF